MSGQAPTGVGAGGSPTARRGDLTQGPLLRTLSLFAIPVMLGNVLQSLNASINTAWIGRLLGEEALAATASANIVMFLVFGTIFGLSMATTVRVGQHFGARDIVAARRSFGAGLGLCLAVSFAIASIGWLGAPRLLDALSLPGHSRALALAYLRVIFLVMPGMTITVMVSTALRGAGDARTPFHFQCLTVLLDVVLNPLLIAGIGPFPHLGIEGSAIATAIATLVGLAGLIGWIYLKDLPLRLRGPELVYLWPRRSELAYILTKGVPMGAQMLVISGAGVIMIGLVNREGLVVAAAYGALLQIWNYMGMPAMAIGAAVSAMVAQHIGAGREGRVDAISRAGAAANLMMTGALIVLMLLFDQWVLRLFLGDASPSVQAALHIQHLAIWTYLPFGITIVLFGTLRAYGVVYAQLAVLFASMYAVRYGAYWLLHPRLGADALWYSLLLSSTMSMALTLLAYGRGGWRRLMLERIAASR